MNKDDFDLAVKWIRRGTGVSIVQHVLKLSNEELKAVLVYMELNLDPVTNFRSTLDKTCHNCKYMFWEQDDDGMFFGCHRPESLRVYQNSNARHLRTSPEFFVCDEWVTKSI